MLSIIRLSDVSGCPKIKLDLPGLRVGDPVNLPKLQLNRTTPEGRYELLDVPSQVFRVTAVGFDASSGPAKQLLSVEVALGKPPAWRSVKRPQQARRRLSPAVFPKTPV